MDIHAFVTETAPIRVTPWSKRPSKVYEDVHFEMYAILDIQQVMVLLTKANGFSMACNLTSAGVDLLLKELHIVQKEFKNVQHGRALWTRHTGTPPSTS